VALIDDHVPALDVSQNPKPLSKGGEPALVAILPLQREVPDPRDLVCRLRVSEERPREHGEQESEGPETRVGSAAPAVAIVRARTHEGIVSALGPRT